MTAPSKAEELWEKYETYRRAESAMSRVAFLAALHEYGQEVRRRDGEICSENLPHAYQFCAAAIAKEPLP